MKILSVLLIFCYSFASACDCKFIKDLSAVQSREYLDNDFIFLGEVIYSNVDEHIYKLIIIEIFKGSVEDSIIISSAVEHSACGLFPTIRDYIWLVYTNKNEQGIIIGDCGLSRSFRYPYLFSDSASLFPPPRSVTNTSKLIKEEFDKLEYRREALEVLNAEISFLRSKRIQGN